MTTVAVLPIKRFGDAKQRLDLESRGELMREMAVRVLAALEAAEELEALIVVTADADAAALARAHGAQVVDEGPLRGHSGAAVLGAEAAMTAGADRVLLVAGDCPLLTADDVDEVLRAHPGDGVVVLADRHGTGTNALLLSPPDVITPAFGPGSRARHEALAHAAGAPSVVHHRRGFALDVDTVDDLAAVERAAS